MGAAQTFTTLIANGDWIGLTPDVYNIRVVYTDNNQTCQWWYGTIEIYIGEPGEIFGCMDPSAFNYNPLAACPCDGVNLSMNASNSSCVSGQTLALYPQGCCCVYETLTSVWGCMDLSLIHI